MRYKNISNKIVTMIEHMIEYEEQNQKNFWLANQLHFIGCNLLLRVMHRSGHPYEFVKSSFFPVFFVPLLFG